MYKCAIVGTGRIAHRHAMVINDHPDLKLIAACDIMPEKVAEFSAQYEIKGYNHLGKMLSEKLPEIVVVCVEAGNHSKVVSECARYSPRVIVCEKPMALTEDDAYNMIQACKIALTKLFIVKQNRYNLPVLKLKEALEKKRFGKLILGTIRLRWHRDQKYFDMDEWRGTWKLDGGVAASQASHHVDLLQWIMGSVQWVMASKKTFLLDIEVDDTLVAILGFDNGALGVIEATNAAQPENLEGSISILGEHGTVVIGGIAVNKMDTWKFDNYDKKMDDDIMNHSENPKDVYGFGHARFYENVVQNIKSGKGTVVDGEEGLKSLKLINAIYESAETGTKVYLKKESKLGK